MQTLGHFFEPLYKLNNDILFKVVTSRNFGGFWTDRHGTGGNEERGAKTKLKCSEAYKVNE
jgi:hypothetical protein